MNVKRSILLTLALMLALSGAVFGSVATAPAPDVSAEVAKATHIDCWEERWYSYDYHYDEGEYRVTVYDVWKRKCWDSWGGVSCGDWQYDGKDTVRTRNPNGDGLGD